jgi:hypothetical protein
MPRDDDIPGQPDPLPIEAGVQSKRRRPILLVPELEKTFKRREK